VISTHETSPSATETVTFVTVLASFSSWAVFLAVAAAAAASAAFLEVLELLDESSLLLELFVLEVETDTLLLGVAFWLPTHELTDEMMTTVMMMAAANTAKAMARLPSEKNASTSPSRPPCCGRLRRSRSERCRWSRPRLEDWRLRTLGRCGFAMLREDWRPDRVEAAS
jgi:hypothetical protein